jgi:GNAT superfamily N-acetyltransferase
VLATGFLDDPLYTYIFAEEEDRRTGLTALFAALAKYTLVFGVCYTTPDLAGVACWLGPGNTEVTFWRAMRTAFGLQTSVARFPAGTRNRFLGVIGYADEAHKRLLQRPHWYLWALGVDPHRQGQGIGSSLIRPILERADEEGLPCYLETETEGNVRFYERRGFGVLESGEIPGHDLALRTMVREPGA